MKRQVLAEYSMPKQTVQSAMATKMDIQAFIK